MPRGLPYTANAEFDQIEARHKELLLAIVTAGIFHQANYDPDWAVAQARKAVALIQESP